MNMSKKSLVASLAIGTILFEILTVSTYSMDYATLKQENSIEEKFNISNDTVTPENIRSHPANINVTLNTVVEQLKKLGKYKFVWNNDVLEISLKFNKNVNTPLLKFQKSGNVINGYDLWTFAGGSLEHKSIGSASLQELDDKKWQLNNSFKNCETQFILFKQTKAKLDKLMNKDELSDDDAKSINDLRFKFNDCVKILDTARCKRTKDIKR